jgi:hypothetical protein
MPRTPNFIRYQTVRALLFEARCKLASNSELRKDWSADKTNTIAIDKTIDKGKVRFILTSV